MSMPTLEERVAALESEISHLKKESTPEISQDIRPWWERIRGRFESDPDYDEAMRLGREYRESLRPRDEEDA